MLLHLMCGHLTFLCAQGVHSKNTQNKILIIHWHDDRRTGGLRAHIGLNNVDVFFSLLRYQD